MVLLALFQKLMGKQLFDRAARARVILNGTLDEVPQLGINDALENAAFLLLVNDGAQDLEGGTTHDV
jgi:hypothetical protein